MQSLNELDPRTLGLRLAEARKARGKTQEEVAAHLGYSRPTYIAIEKGDRELQPEEIKSLADFLGRRVHELVRPGEPIMDLQPHLRAVAEKMKDTDVPELRAGIDELQKYTPEHKLLFVPLAWNFFREIKNKIQSARTNPNDRFVKYFPSVEIHQ